MSSNKIDDLSNQEIHSSTSSGFTVSTTEHQRPAKRQKTSKVWQYYDNPPTAPPSGKVIGICNVQIIRQGKIEKCGHMVKTDGGTGNFLSHLSGRHGITKDMIQEGERKEPKTSGSIEEYIKRTSNKTAKNEIVNQALVEFIIGDEQPLYILRSKWFEKFIKTLNPYYDFPSEKK